MFTALIPELLLLASVGIAGWMYYHFGDLLLAAGLAFSVQFVGSYLTRRAAPESPDNARNASSPLLGFVLLGVLLLAGFNYTINPFGIYPPKFYDPIVLTSRREKVRLYAAYNPPPEVVILGTSRSFTMPPAYIEELTGASAFNASFHGGQTRDFLAFTRYMVERGHPPELVILPLSPESFSFEDPPAPEPEEPLRDYIEETNSIQRELDKIYALFGITQTNASFELLRVEARGRGVPHYEFGPDGQAKFNIPYPLDEMVKIYLEGPWDVAFWQDRELIPIGVSNFEEFLRLCEQNRIAVIGYMPPFHPDAVALYNSSSDFPALKAELGALAEGWEREYKFTFHDFSELDSFGGTAWMFHDAVHPTAEASRLMLDIMLADYP
jgi:hypothetical protein